MILCLLRHGETAWSLSGQHTGVTDIPLTARGEAEARALNARLAGVIFSHVLTSPRLRARQTCELAGVTPAATIEPDLAEWDYGDYEGRRSDEIRERRPEWNLFRDGCPNGESPADVSDRADRVITRLRTLDGRVAAFSHGHFGRVLGARWIGLHVTDAEHLLLSTASLSLLGYEGEQYQGANILLWNGVSNNHLDVGPMDRAHHADTQAVEPRV